MAASAGVLLARRPGAMSKTTVTALQAMGYGWAMGKWMEMGNSSPSVALSNDCVLCPEIQYSFPSDRPGQAFEQVLCWGWVHGVEMA